MLAYAFSPIDLIPDFIPVLGLLADALLLPLGIPLALRLIPAHIMAEARERAKALDREKRSTRVAGAVVIVLLWLVVVGLVGRYVWWKLRP